MVSEHPLEPARPGGRDVRRPRRLRRPGHLCGYRRLLLRGAARRGGGAPAGRPPGRERDPARDASGIHHAGRGGERPGARAGGAATTPPSLLCLERDPGSLGDPPRHSDGTVCADQRGPPARRIPAGVQRLQPSRGRPPPRRYGAGLKASEASERCMAAEDEFPESPVPAAGAIVFRDGAILLVKRGAEPNAGRWSLPGGLVEVGETVESAVIRETMEETHIRVRPLRVFDVAAFIRVETGRVRWHYVLIDMLCEYQGGEPFPDTDAANARFIPLRERGEYDVTESAREIIGRKQKRHRVIDQLHIAARSQDRPQERKGARTAATSS